MKELYIRNKADTGDGESNRSLFRSIYYNQEGHLTYFCKLANTGIITPYKRKVIQLKRKVR